MIVDHHTWETGAEPGIPLTGDANPPISEALKTTTPLSGFGSWLITFASNDNWVLADINSLYQRTLVADGVGFNLRCKINKLSDHDHFSWYTIFNTSNPDEFYLGFTIEADGSIALRSADIAGSTFASEPVIAQTGAGVISDDTEHCIQVWFTLADAGGRAVLAVDNTKLIDFTGDTKLGNLFGTELTAWGRGAYVSTINGALTGTGEVEIDDLVYHADETDVLPPMRFVGLVPDAVTAENAGTVFGGAGNAALATDERPATGTDGFTLDLVNDRQGLGFEALPGGEGTIRCATLEGAIGDSAAGSETFTAELDDGLAQSVGPTLGAGVSFANRKLTNIEELDPSGGAWTSSTINALTAVIDRTA